ncbi:class C sortase [Actinomycetales bacterium SN12]|nr:class C sortase [Actinomycetales bacterium SN12]
MLVVLYPEASSWFSQYNQSALIESYDEQLEDDGLDPTAAELLAEARSYNEALNAGALLEENERLPTGDGSSSDGSLEYERMLRTPRSDLMARLRIPDIDVDLPVYHGTSDDTLDRGVGHLEGTSLPVGGEGTHSVLTAHRGLAHATMFTNLDRVETGDVFSIEVLGEVLSYRVVRTVVVEPDESEALRPVVGQDLVTLVTCTPLGINTQRILVTGERILPTPESEIDAMGAKPDLPRFSWWAVIAVCGTLLVIGYLYIAGLPPRRRQEKPAEQARP